MCPDFVPSFPSIEALFVRTLLPDLIKFAYIAQNELRIHADSQPQTNKNKTERGRSPDFALASTHLNVVEPEEHVLVLEFAENSKGKKSENPS